MRSAQALAVALTWFATVTPGAPLAYTVRLDTTATPVLAGTHVGTFSQAVRRFGKPDRVAAVAGTPAVCKVSWLRYRLEIRFLTEEAGACAASALGSWWQV